jgi:hypothetical protein
MVRRRVVPGCDRMESCGLTLRRGPSVEVLTDMQNITDGLIVDDWCRMAMMSAFSLIRKMVY